MVKAEKEAWTEPKQTSSFQYCKHTGAKSKPWNYLGGVSQSFHRYKHFGFLPVMIKEDLVHSMNREQGRDTALRQES